MKKLLQLLKNTGLITLLAILGACGGQGPRWARRFVFPGVVMIYALYITHNLWCISIYLVSLALSMGYGVPNDDFPENPNADSGSTIGLYFTVLFRKWFNRQLSHRLGDIFTRAVIGALISASMLSIPILKGTWLSFLIGSGLIIGIWGSISYRDFGQTPLKIFGKTYQLLIVDLIVYGITSCGILIMINGYFG